MKVGGGSMVDSFDEFAKTRASTIKIEKVKKNTNLEWAVLMGFAESLT
jgi:hypothetical protein